MKSALLFISFLTLCHGVKLNNVTDVDVRLLQNIGKTILARSSTDPTVSFSLKKSEK
jgi:hypothetical protein